MKIALIAPINHPITPPFKGGLEAHTWWLAKKLIARGHKVTVFASGDSDPSLPLISIRHQSLFSTPWFQQADGKILKARIFRFLRNVETSRAYSKATKYIAAHKFDIVHNNAIAAKPLRDVSFYNAPTVTILHTPIFREILRGVKAAGKKSSYIAVSNHLAKSWRDFADATVIHNGINKDDWTFSETAKLCHAIWYGRMTKDKAPHDAIQAAIKAGYHLDLYGSSDDVEYFETQVSPLLNEKNIIHHGIANHETLHKKIGEASVMISTPHWDEPFGLTYIEALACGTPVATYQNGAVDEILDPKTSVVVPMRDIDALAAALDKAASLSRKDCRASFEEKFTIDRMIEKYEDFYKVMVR